MLLQIQHFVENGAELTFAAAPHMITELLTLE
jgi:hypothetical protein